MSSIDTPDLKSMLERGEEVLLVNTLPSERFEETKLPGAVNIPQDRDDFVEQVEQRAGGKDKKIVVYCANIECDSSHQAATKLDHAGFVDVVEYRGGAKAWQDDVVAKASRTAG